MRELVFLDVETTGLNPSGDRIVELTYGLGYSKLQTLYFGVKEVPEFIDNLIKFKDRGLDKIERSSDEDFADFLEVTKDNTIVGANPSFDKSFLQAAGLWNAHYRMLDIESFAMGIMDLPSVPSLNDIRSELENMGYTGITKPKHSSYSDTMCLRDCFHALMDLNGNSLPYSNPMTNVPLA
jgi:DNA polymerase III epsilon subunit-like protein